jgi:copper oxidase (laccase) domain-containing protein
LPGGLTLRLTTAADGDMMDPHVLSRCVADLDLVPETLVVCRQVHGARVIVARPGAEPEEADGLKTTEPMVPLVLRGADCPLVCLYDEDTPGLVVVHAGWRGIVAGVVEAGLVALGRPDRFRAWIAAHAGPCCYEVGEEVAAEFPA